MATQKDPLAQYWLVESDHPDIFPTPKRFLDDIGIKPTDDADFEQLGKDYTALYKKYLKASGAHEWQQEAMAQAVQRNFFTGAFTREDFDRNYDAKVNPAVAEKPAPAPVEGGGFTSGVIHGAVQAVASTVKGAAELGDAIDNKMGWNGEVYIPASASPLKDVPFVGDIFAIGDSLSKTSWLSGDEMAAMEALNPGWTRNMNAVREAGKAIGNVYRDENPSKWGAAVGSAVPTLAAGAVGALRGLSTLQMGAAMGAQSASQLASEGVEDYRRTLIARGEIPNEGTQGNVALLNSALSVVDMFPGGTVAKKMGLSALDTATGGLVKKVLTGASAEAIQEMLQTTGQNYIAAEMVQYDPNRGLLQGTVDAGEGGAVAGAFMNALEAALVGRRGGHTAAPPTDPFTPASPTGPSSPQGPTGGVGEQIPLPISDQDTVALRAGVNPFDAFANQVKAREGVAAYNQAAAQPNQSAPKSGLSSLIASGEGDYQSFNRGVAGDTPSKIDFSQYTIGDVIARQSLPKGHPDRIFAVGKYQIIPDTMQEAVTALRIPLNTPFTPAVQEQLFSDYLAKDKRPHLRDYIMGRSDSLQAAGIDLAAEWRSIADPRTGKTYADAGASAGGNKAAISAEQAAAQLVSAREAYQRAVAAGMSPTQAYRTALSTPTDPDAFRQMGLPAGPAVPSYTSTPADPRQLGLPLGDATANQTTNPTSQPLPDATANQTTNPTSQPLPDATANQTTNPTSQPLPDAAPLSAKAGTNWDDGVVVLGGKTYTYLGTDPSETGTPAAIRLRTPEGKDLTLTQPDVVISVDNARLTADIEKSHDPETITESIIRSDPSAAVRLGLTGTEASPGGDKKPTVTVKGRRRKAASSVPSPAPTSAEPDSLIPAEVLAQEPALNEGATPNAQPPSDQPPAAAEPALAAPDALSAGSDAVDPTPTAPAMPSDTQPVNMEAPAPVGAEAPAATPAPAAVDGGRVSDTGVAPTPAPAPATAGASPAPASAPVVAKRKPSRKLAVAAKPSAPKAEQEVAVEASALPPPVMATIAEASIKAAEVAKVRSDVSIWETIKGAPDVSALVKALKARGTGSAPFDLLLDSITAALASQQGRLYAKPIPVQFDELKTYTSKTSYMPSGGSVGVNMTTGAPVSLSVSNPEHTLLGRFVSSAAFRDSLDPNTRADVMRRVEERTVDDLLAGTLAHEMIHAITSPLLVMARSAKLASKLTPAEAKFVADINALFELVKKDYVTKYQGPIQKAVNSGGSVDNAIPTNTPPIVAGFMRGDVNALRNADEMLAWGLTSKSMQDYLRSISTEGASGKSAWSRFTAALRNLMGLGRREANVLDQLLSAYGALSDAYHTNVPDAAMVGAEEDTGVDPAPAEPAPAEPAPAEPAPTKKVTGSWARMATIPTGKSKADIAEEEAMAKAEAEKAKKAEGETTAKKPRAKKTATQPMNLATDAPAPQPKLDARTVSGAIEAALATADDNLSTLSEQALYEVFGAGKALNEAAIKRNLREFFRRNYDGSGGSETKFIGDHMKELKSSGVYEAIVKAYTGSAPSGPNLTLTPPAKKSRPKWEDTEDDFLYQTENVTGHAISPKRATTAINRILKGQAFTEMKVAKVNDQGNPIHGMVVDGELYIDVNHMPSAAYAEMVAAEVLSHRGDLSLFGADYTRMLTELYAGMAGSDGLRAFLKRQGVEVPEALFSKPPATQIEETLAYIAAGKGTLSVRAKRQYTNLTRHIRSQMREIGAVSLPNLADADLVHMTHRIRAASDANAPFITPEEVSAAANENIRANTRPSVEAGAYAESLWTAYYSRDRQAKARYTFQDHARRAKATLNEKRIALQQKLFKSDSAFRREKRKWFREQFKSDAGLQDILMELRGFDPRNWPADQWKKMRAEIIRDAGAFTAAVRQRDHKVSAIHESVENNMVKLEAAIRAIYGKPRTELTKEERAELSARLHSPSIDDPLLGYFRDHIDRMSVELIRRLHVEMGARIGELNQSGLELLAQNTDRIRDPMTKVDTLEPVLRPIAALQRQIDVITQNIGDYMHTSYQIFHDPAWSEKVKDTPAYTDAIHYTMRENSLGWDRAQALVDSYLNDVSQETDMVAASMHGRKDHGILKQKNKSLPPEIKRLLGEIEDPVYNYAATVTKIANFVAAHEFQSHLRHLGLEYGYFSRTLEPGYVATFSGDKSWSMLHDVYAPQEVIDALAALGPLKSPNSTWVKWMVMASAVVKTNKTVLSPTTAARNLLSGFIILASTGHIPSIKDLHEAAVLLRDSKSRLGLGGRIANATTGKSGDFFLSKEEATDMKNWLIQLGVLNSGARSEELMQLFKDIQTEENGRLKERGGLGRAMDAAVEFYRFGDDYFKLIFFMRETADLIKGGMRPAEAELEAARRTSDLMPTYDRIPRALKRLRRFPLAATFVSFPWEVVRTSANAVRYARADYDANRRGLAAKRMIGMGIAHFGMMSVAAISMMLAGVDWEDDALVDAGSPSYAKGQLRLYTGGQDGKLEYINLSALSPTDYIWAGVRSGWRTGSEKGFYAGLREAGWKWVSPFASTDITVQAAMEVLDNRSADGGYPIYGRGKTFGDIWADAADGDLSTFSKAATHAAFALGPGVLNNMSDFARANASLQGEGDPGWIEWLASIRGGPISRHGKEFNNADALAALVGFRSTTLDTSVLTRGISDKVKISVTAASENFAREMGQATAMSDEAVQSLADKLLSDRAKAYQLARQAIDYHQKENMPKGKIAEILASGGLTDDEVRALLAGRTPMYELGKSQMKSMTQRAFEALDKADPASAWQTKHAIVQRLNTAARYLRQQQIAANKNFTGM